MPIYLKIAMYIEQIKNSACALNRSSIFALANQKHQFILIFGEQYLKNESEF